MVGVFRRSLSFPAKINPSRSLKPEISQHIRSVSLLVRSHPLFSQLGNDVSDLRSQWLSGGGAVRTLDWILDGLRRLRDVHECLSEILCLPQTQDCLRNRCEEDSLAENLLEDLLRFVDVFGTFRTSILALREHQAESQAALRRRDETKIAMYLKARRRIAKEIAGLSASVRRCTKLECHVITVESSLSYAEAELAAVITEVMEATAVISLALFNGVNSALGCSKTASCGAGLLRRGRNVRVEEGIEELKGIRGESLSGLRKMKNEDVRVVLRKMRELEEGILGIEIASEKVFRSLINTRVSLLNLLTK
ncbi:PREDICTED: uncharacterized protein LOC104807040 [Tarenaya hassleriana]|uniref:uncharacterized protein LOC104807040 n=1 Tax=Tarenaya hassleriana TaxID=28532 RepID=UPI00053C6764|nr:PREDICTED: uncharacterized protein LOC104807040 [Tarenaya hassleriana]